MRTYVCIMTLMTMGLPLLGAWLAGQDLGHFLAFPPLTEPVAAQPFSWRAFLLVSLAGTLVVAMLFYPYAVLRVSRRMSLSSKPIPWWGWLSLCVLLLLWWIAWTPEGPLAAFRPYTFTPLWCSFIVCINAWTDARTGRCILHSRPRYLLLLFFCSALFWWYFEYLNRYVKNWYYIDLESYTATRYILQATCSFATVLPAVASVTEWLASLVQPQFQENHRLAVSRPTIWAQGLLLLASAGLIGIGLWPTYFYPMVWGAPLLLGVALLMLTGHPWASLATQPRLGDLHLARLSALAALVCGGFWEMWNYYSDPKWLYAVPYVGVYKIFEMPVLGYVGYLPFGLECFLVSTLLGHDVGSRHKPTLQ